MSCLAGVAVGCGNILGLDDNKPVFDCSRCGSGYRCDSTRLVCGPMGGSAGAGGNAAVQGSVINGGTAGSHTVAGAYSGGGSTTAPGGSTVTTGGAGGHVVGGVAGSGGIEIGGATGGTPPTVGGVGGVTMGGNGGTYDGGGVGGTNGGAGGLSLGGQGGIAGGGVAGTTSGGGVAGGGTTTVPRVNWLAYISSSGGSNRAWLRLYDPAKPPKLTFPKSPEETADVKDFKFSPDGQFLAYRLDGDPKRLMLLSAPNWQEHKLEFQELSVAEYAWSPYAKLPDPSILAVALGADDNPDKRLGGVRVTSMASNATKEGGGGTGGVSGVLANPTAGAASVIGLKYLEPPIQVRTQSELVWFGAGRFVAFHAPSDEFEYAQFAELAGDHFEAHTPLSWAEKNGRSVQLIPTDDGFWAVDPEYGVYFWQLPQQQQPPQSLDLSFFLHTNIKSTNAARDLVLAPSARFEMRTCGKACNPDELRLYSPDNLSSGKGPRTSDCPVILAWERTKNQFTCVADTPTAGVIRTFSIDAFTSGSTSPQGIMPDGECKYSQEEGVSRRRAFSAQGQWFVFTTAKATCVTNVADGGVPKVVPLSIKLAESDANAVAFSFSPDESWLLEQHGESLSLHNLNYTDDFIAQLSTRVKPPGACEQTFLGEPDNWCGNEGNSMELPWSPDSRWVVWLAWEYSLRKDDRSLYILDLGGNEARFPLKVSTSAESNCRLPQFQP